MPVSSEAFPRSVSPSLRCLLLSSNPSPSAAQAAIALLVGSKSRAAIVTTASFEHKEKNRNAIIAHHTFEEMGFRSVEFFDLDVSSAHELALFDLIYLAGGNPHYLLKRLRETGGDHVVSSLIGAGRPFVGSSTGALVLGRSTAVVDSFDPALESHGFLSRAGLSLVPFSMLPHANRWREKYADYERLLADVRGHSEVPVIELNDNQALLLRAGEVHKIAL
jgi:peptidase E